MAEQYSSFNSQGPNIDVNLFVNAASAGINQGNAQDTTLGSIFKGVSKGVQSGIATYTAVQQAQSAAAKAEVDTDEGVIQARKDYEIEKARLEKNKAETEAKTGALDAQNQSKVLEQRGAEAEQKLGDTRILQTLTDLLSPGSQVTGEQINAVLSTPAVRGTLSRNSDQVASVLAQARAKGADPAQLTAMGEQFQAEQRQKQEIARIENIEKKKEEAKLKDDNEFTDSLASLNGLQGVPETLTSKGFDYQKLKIYPSNQVNVGPSGTLQTENGKVKTTPQVGPEAEATGFVLAYGDKVLDTLNRDEGRSYGTVLQKFKKGASVRPEYNTPKDTTSAASTPAASVPDQNLGLAGASQSQLVSAPQGATNQNVVGIAKQRNEKALNLARASGTENSYQALISTGASLAQKNTPVPDYIKTNQSVPVPQGAPKITQPVATLEPLTSDEISAVTMPQFHLAKLLGTDPNRISFDYVPTIDHDTKYYQEAFKRVNNIPALKDAPAILKGLVLIESQGKNSALGTSGERGIFQFMEATAGDVGLSPEDRTDIEKATPAAMQYLRHQYEGIENVLTKQFSDQGLAVKVDPRMVLAAWNGGLKWIKRGIQAGNTTWPEMEAYLFANKSPENAKINTEYPNKVIEASIPFMLGGNASDDSYAKTLLEFGIVSVR